MISALRFRLRILLIAFSFIIFLFLFVISFFDFPAESVRLGTADDGLQGEKNAKIVEL